MTIFRNDSERLGLLALVTILILLLFACDRGPRLEPLSRSGVILAFGDSLTRGTGAERDSAYPAVLGRRLDMQIVNAGVPGELSSTGLKRLPSVLEKYQPELVILCHGGNDLLQRRSRTQLKENLEEMIRWCRASGAQVILVGVPSPGLFLHSAELYSEVAAETKTVYLDDILAEILADRSLKSDAVHPNGKGYAELAEAITELIRPALK